MSTYTTNYNLEKPDSTDDFKDFRLNYNSNMDIIDANLGGGGGGNVDDVLVNGVSVVDGNHDAQITSYKEVTQAEYDALPATKLTDGIAYFIKDAGGGGSSSHNYSTTEQVIGTWIDGKPVYEKTFTGLSQATSGTAWLVVTGTDIANLKEIINADIYGLSGENALVHMAIAEYTAYQNKLRIEMVSNTFNRTITMATIQYTKTTD